MINKNLYATLVQTIDKNFLKARLSEMIAIKSENPFDEEPRVGYREKEMGQYYMEAMHTLGLEVSSKDIRPSRPNVFGFQKGTKGGTTLMLAGHMDTARTDGYSTAYDVKEEGGKIFGRGACDMKGALAANLEVVRILNRGKVKLKGNLIVAGIADEEYQMLGSKDVGRNGPCANQGIIGEPSNLAVCPANKGRVTTFIRTFGQAAHSSVPEKGINAIANMGKAIQALSTYNNDLLGATAHPLCGHGRFNPGVIRGGVQANMVPDLCELEVDRRTLPGETKEKVYTELHSYLAPLLQGDPEFQYEITEPTWLIPYNDVSPHEPVVQSLLAAYKEVMGRPTAVTSFAAGSDAPHMGFPTIICGPGSLAQAHTTLEFISVEQLIKAVKMYLWVALDLLT